MKSNDAFSKDSILVIAAEASSCMYAKSLIQRWKVDHPETHFFGVGDRQMEAGGMQCLGYAEEMAVVGLVEAVKHYPAIKKVADETLKLAQQRKPQFALLLDYPGFNLRFAKKLKEMGIPVVYYISPQLWAWKKGRVKQVKSYVDEMLVVFPFEVEFYKQYGIDAHFVGHPLVEVVEQEIDKTPSAETREKKILGLMPGSRKSEIQYNLQTQIDAARVLSQNADVAVKLLLAPTLKPSDISSYLSDLDFEIETVQAPPTQMINGCDLILTASGTATLQVALCEKPMVVMYKMNSVTAFFAKWLVNTVDSFCIVNLIAGKKIVPELFQEEANVKRLVQELAKILRDQDYTQNMLKELSATKAKLGKNGATENVYQFLRDRFYLR